MAKRIQPVVDQWYRHRDKGQRFFVTAVDTDSDTVEVQHFDSDLEEFSLEQWYQLDIEPSEEPENWSGAIDLSEVDDYGTEVTDTEKQDWDEALNEINPDQQNSDVNDGNDDYGEGYMEANSMDDQDSSASDTNTLLAEDGLIKRPDGVYEESFSDDWYAEYAEDSDSGLWLVKVFKDDMPEWRNIDFETLDEAREAARNYYDQL